MITSLDTTNTKDGQILSILPLDDPDHITLFRIRYNGADELGKRWALSTASAGDKRGSFHTIEGAQYHALSLAIEREAEQAWKQARKDAADQAFREGVAALALASDVDDNQSPKATS